MTEITDKDKLTEDEPAKDTPKSAAKLKSKKKAEPFYKNIWHRFGRYILESLSVVMTLAILWLGALGVLMNKEAVNLSFMKDYAQSWFAKAFDGRGADIGELTAHWVQDRRSIVMKANDIKIKGRDGTGQSIQSFQTTFALANSLWAAPELKRVETQGGSLTLLRKPSGDILIGLGRPDTIENIEALWRLNQKNTPEKPGATPGWLDSVSAIDGITISNGDIYIRDQIDDFRLDMKSVNAALGYQGEHLNIKAAGFLQQNVLNTEGNDQNTANNEAAAFTLVKTQNSPKFNVQLSIYPDGRIISADINASGINLAKLAPKSGNLSGLADLDALIDIRSVIAADEEGELQTLDVEFTAGSGALKTGSTFKPFDGAALNAKLDRATQLIDITDLDITSEALTLQASGTLSLLSELGDAAERPFLSVLKSRPIAFDVDLKQGRLNPGADFDGALEIQSGKLSGNYTHNEGSLRFENLDLDFGEYQTDLRVWIDRTRAGDLSALSISGQINGEMRPHDLLGFWPNTFALGARNWIVKAVKTAKLSDFVITADLDAADFKNGFIANENLNLRFDVRAADVQYMNHMPWLRGANGYGTLQGNSFDFWLTEASVDGLTVEKAKVNIPRLTPKGGDLNIELDASGTVSEMMRVSNFPPFEFAKRFGISPDSLGGQGKVNIKVTRPLLEFYDRNRIIYNLDGAFTGVSLPAGFGQNRLNSGELRLIANAQSVDINGTVKLGAWPASLTWRKPLGEGSPAASYALSGKVDRETLDSFGIGFRRNFGGSARIIISGAGDGLSVSTANITADFANSEINFGTLWAKPVGVPGALSANLQMGGENASNPGAALRDININAPGLNVSGEAEFNKNNALEAINLDALEIEGFVDTSVQFSMQEDGTPSMLASGKFINIEQWVSRAFKAKPSEFAMPLRLTANFETAALSPKYMLRGASLYMVHSGDALLNARLKGEAETGAFLAEIVAPPGDDNRKINIDIPNAGNALLSILGQNNIEGGHLIVNANMAKPDMTPGISGEIKLTDFTVIRAPAFAQILSLASLTGLADTMSGEGLAFNEFQSQFGLAAGVLKIREARAAGPALGLTANGDLNFTNKVVDLTGVLVPSYSVNSVLGEVPLLGDIIVGKKGEGMFALNYSVAGDFAKTQVSVNPLSALTPGFLRRIFDTQREDIVEQGEQNPPALPVPEDSKPDPETEP